MSSEFLTRILHSVANRELSVEQATEKLRTLGYEGLDFAKLDHHRPLRTGFPEVVWGPGKTPEQIAAILGRLVEKNPVAMATRVEPEVYERISALLPGTEYLAAPRICLLRNSEFTSLSYPGRIGVVTAGTADIPVAEEAAVTADLCGYEVLRLWDVGVAGLHRLLDNLPILNRADVLIVVAGMEGALASVVGGLSAVPVIAVPTSIGYGASFGGVAALLSMLNSCAAGIAVVNIDNGFGAAMMAARILRTGEQRNQQRS